MNRPQVPQIFFDSSMSRVRHHRQVKMYMGPKRDKKTGKPLKDKDGKLIKEYNEIPPELLTIVAGQKAVGVGEPDRMVKALNEEPFRRFATIQSIMEESGLAREGSDSDSALTDIGLRANARPCVQLGRFHPIPTVLYNNKHRGGLETAHIPSEGKVRVASAGSCACAFVIDSGASFVSSLYRAPARGGRRPAVEALRGHPVYRSEAGSSSTSAIVAHPSSLKACSSARCDTSCSRSGFAMYLSLAPS